METTMELIYCSMELMIESQKWKGLQQVIWLIFMTRIRISKSYFISGLQSQIMETTTLLGNLFPTSLLPLWEQFSLLPKLNLLQFSSWSCSDQKFSLLFAVAVSHNLAMFLFCLKILFLNIPVWGLPVFQWWDATV